MSLSISDVTAIIINHRTQDLTQTCVEGLMGFYPSLKIIVMDNDSRDASTAYVADLARQQPSISAILNRRTEAPSPIPKVGLRDTLYGSVFDFDPPDPEYNLADGTVQTMLGDGNIGHGPGLHQALMLAKTPYLLALDSDCIVLRSGFIELMLDFFKDENVYAVGRKFYCDQKGHQLGPSRGYEQLHPSVIMLDVEKYRNVEPFVNFGVPTLITMPDAVRGKGYRLVDFQIGPDDTWVHHLFAGTRQRFHMIAHLRFRPIMPRVMLEGLRTEFVGDYFD